MDNISNGFVIAMGLGVVFVGLICIVLLCVVMSWFCKERNTEAKTTESVPAPNVAPNEPIANKQELIAGICAVIAEELGTDVSGIRILSFKKL